MALTNISGPITAGLAVTVEDDNYNQPKSLINQTVSQNASFGSGVGQVNKFYSAQATIAPSGTLTLTLDDDSLIDLFGNLNTFTELKSIRISHKSDSLASDVTLGGNYMDTNFAGTTNPFTDNMSPGGFYHKGNLQSGYAVVATTGNVISIVNNDGSNAATVTVELFGD